MRTSLLTLVFLFVCGWGFAQSADEQAIDKVVDAYNKAITTKDSVSLKKLLSDNCSMTDPGSTHDKKGIIDVFCGNTYDVSKVSVAKRVFSRKQDKLQTVVTSDIGVSVNGSDMSGTYITTFTFLKQDGEWLISDINITNN